MNYFISHPRSGRNWQRVRVLYFLRNMLGRKKIDYTAMDKIVHFTHMGFEQAYKTEGFQPVEAFLRTAKSGDNITLLLRRAEAIVNSFWFYTVANNSKALSDSELTEIDSFARGPLGAQRFALFLHNMKELSKHFSLRVLFYEDAFGPEFCREVPAIVGSNYVLSEEEANKILVSSTDDPGGRKRIGTPDNYKNTMPESTQEYVRSIVGACGYYPYLERYSDD